MKNIGTISIGIKTPLISKGDNLEQIVIDSIKESEVDIDNDDVICITESVLARSQGNYCSVDDIVEDLTRKELSKNILLYSPIMSRNRFSLILRAFARYADSIIIVKDGEYDEQGNPNYTVNPFTGVNMEVFYGHICHEEKCDLVFYNSLSSVESTQEEMCFIDARCHPKNNLDYTLKDFMNESINDSGYNKEYGLLGSNIAGDELLKLFPVNCNEFCNEIQEYYKITYNKNIHVLVYGDGCFKDPVGEIWEFADPVTCPGYTKELEGTPNEVKIKYMIDTLHDEQKVKECISEMCNKNLLNKKESQGTTPRNYTDLLASLADLTSGSGSKGTPIVYIKNYFKNYTN